MKKIKIYGDGAYSSKLQKGGFAAVLLGEGLNLEITGSNSPTTNQKMELMAAIVALEYLETPHDITFYSDSAYLINCFKDQWYLRWVRNNWQNAEGKPVANRDLWERLFEAVKGHKITWEKVKGHTGDPMNDRCDFLAKKACRS